MDACFLEILPKDKEKLYLSTRFFKGERSDAGRGTSSKLMNSSRVCKASFDVRVRLWKGHLSSGPWREESLIVSATGNGPNINSVYNDKCSVSSHIHTSRVTNRDLNTSECSVGTGKDRRLCLNKHLQSCCNKNHWQLKKVSLQVAWY